MASTNSNATFYNVGETVGFDQGGSTVSVPTVSVQNSAISLATVVMSGSAAPTAAPGGRAPIFRNTAQDNIYVWQGTWIGPYNKGT